MKKINVNLNVKYDLVKKEKGLVIIVHGLAEHLERYNELTTYLNNNFYSVIRYDLRGHGKTTGIKMGTLNNFNEMLDDLDKIIYKAKDKTNNKIYLLGHSMGGEIVNLYAVSDYKNLNSISGIISIGAVTNYLRDINLIRHIPYKLLNKISIKNKCDGKLSFDKENENNYKTDDLVLKKYYMSLITNMFILGIKYLQNNIKNFNKPVLYIHGLKDSLVPYYFSEYMFDNISSQDKKIYIFNNSKHEVLNDKEKNIAFNKILGWLNR